MRKRLLNRFVIIILLMVTCIVMTREEALAADKPEKVEWNKNVLQEYYRIDAMIDTEKMETGISMRSVPYVTIDMTGVRAISLQGFTSTSRCCNNSDDVIDFDAYVEMQVGDYHECGMTINPNAAFYQEARAEVFMRADGVSPCSKCGRYSRKIYSYSFLVVTKITPYCTKQPQSVTANVGGTSSLSVNGEYAAGYRWQKLVGDKYVDLTDGASETGTSYIGSDTATLKLSNISYADNNASYRCTMSGVNGGTGVSSPASIKIEDNVKPSIAVTKSTDKKTSAPVILTVAAGDTGSGLADSPYSYDGGITYCESNTYAVTQNGEYLVCVIDKVGNVASTRVWVSNIVAPTPEPTYEPMPEPTLKPTAVVTSVPIVTDVPTTSPTVSPTKNPDRAPTAEPTKVPTKKPEPTNTGVPTANPTAAPVYPTIVPTNPTITYVPLPTATYVPTDIPVGAPTAGPGSDSHSPGKGSGESDSSGKAPGTIYDRDDDGDKDKDKEREDNEDEDDDTAIGNSGSGSDSSGKGPKGTGGSFSRNYSSTVKGIKRDGVLYVDEDVHVEEQDDGESDGLTESERIELEEAFSDNEMTEEGALLKKTSDAELLKRIGKIVLWIVSIFLAVLLVLLILFFGVIVEGECEDKDDVFDFCFFRIVMWKNKGWWINLSDVFEENAVVRLKMGILFVIIFKGWELIGSTKGARSGEVSGQIEQKMLLYRRKIRRETT